MTVRMVELFAGIGAQATAMENLGIDFTSTVSEIDQRAYKVYCAIHGPTENLGDITKIEHLPPCDLITYSFPCQDLSIAGKRAGMEEGSGTRSSLLWEVGRLLDDLASRNELPEHLVMENVDAILNEKNRPFYEEWKRRLDELGYITTDGILNAKDFGVPQNRKRCFAVSVLKRSKGGKIGMAYVMPKGRPLELRLKDMLESNVPESYYLSQERIANYERHRLRQEANGRGFGWKPMIPEESVAHTFTGNQTRNTGNFIVDKSQTKLELTDAKGEPLSIQSKQSEQKVQLEYNRLPDEKYDIEARAYDTGKLSPTLRTKSFNVKIEEDRE